MRFPLPVGASKMADKLNDDDIVSELKRFGETVKVPIDRKRRPILIKKLNHYYARENPPAKRVKSGSRQPKTQTKSAEFSDDSQDESEFESRRTRTSISDRNSTSNNSMNRNTSRKQRYKAHDNGATGSNLSRSSIRSRGANAKSRNTREARQVEIYPDEFSDNDTAEESVYEVEEQSIGINTSMNYEDDDDTEDDIAEQVVYPKQNTPSNKMVDVNISTVSPHAYSGRGNVKRKAGMKENESEHFISKTILTVMGIFFVILAVSYIYVKRDFFLPGQAAALQQGNLF